LLVVLQRSRYDRSVQRNCRRSGLPPASGDIGTGLPQALMHTYQVVVAVLPDRGCSIHLHIFRESQRLSHLACIEHTAGQVAALNVSCARVFRSIAKHTQDLYPLAMLVALFDRLNVLPVCTRLLKGGYLVQYIPGPLHKPRLSAIPSQPSETVSGGASGCPRRFNVWNT